ncbi:MAG TPA: membrane protein insertase YidC [bacterium]|nr:membrane protein insertase YidC [bacterium]HQG44089.1 membrane protein insertase YidC [bacterium]HQI47562.1 membrane protein insertase YidC [bacterium]HQJ63338.1 membrane protein insertase YidC [bacterium]
MNLDKKTILAFLLIGLVFLFVQSPIYQKLFFAQNYQKQMAAKEAKAAADDSLGTVAAKNEVLPAETLASAPIDSVRQTMLTEQQIPAREITVETDLYTAVLSTRGGTLQGWTLKKYQKAPKEPVSLLPVNSRENLGLDFVTREEDTLRTGLYNFSCEAPDKLVADPAGTTITFTRQLDKGRTISKSYTFHNGRYDFDLEVSLVGMGSLVADKSYELIAPNGLESSEVRMSEDMYYAKAAIAAAGRVNKITKTAGVLEKESGSIEWVAVRTKYFAYAIIPRTAKGTFATILGKEYAWSGDDKLKWKKFAIGLGMPLVRDNSRDRFTIFIGPMHDDLLKSYKIGLEKFMDMGMKIIQPFSIAILWTFKKLYAVIPNYGLVLILFALIIKLITAPLTHKSTVSMKRMQALQPRMEELKEKYAKDPQKLNQETMKLYKEEGVNPMGGCLPILLQMPLLWALFIVFRTTISLRQQGFFWWIKDLSGPDTVYTLPFTIPWYGNGVNILPILMGVTMIIQQKMSISDPKQKAMVYFMPIFMTLLFNNFPSGLNLYYTLFNIIAIIHQKYFMGLDEVAVAPAKRKV